MLWRAFSLGGEYKWIHILDDIVDKYNNTVHSTTRMKPVKVTARNERSLLKSTYTHLKIANQITKFKVGDHVRISKYREAFEKGYTPNWSSEIFIIRKIRLSNPTTYLLQDEADKEITGGFYELELQKAKHPDAHLVEKVLRKKGNKRTRTAKSKFTEADRALICEDINSIPRDISHYTRAKSDKQYLSPDLNIHRLHKAFIQKYSDSLVTYKFYKHIFLKNFPQLSFRRPRTDTCKFCDKLHCEIRAHTARSEEAKQELQLHQRKAEAATSAMKKDIIESQLPGTKFSVLSMDLEQVLFVPTLTHSDMFYMSQLSCYNLCTNLGDRKESFMCFWHEGVSGRGANEVASCLLRTLNDGITTKKNLIVWINTGQFDTIEHKYLVSGHSLLQCDRDFALIEKRKKQMMAMVPEDLHNVIMSSTHTGRFSVIDMAKLKYSLIYKLILNLKNVNISKVVHIKVDKQHPGVLFTKENHSPVAPWKETKVLKKGKTCYLGFKENNDYPVTRYKQSRRI
ncbi:hypothetical protein NQ315_012509 [Exocentrus adspersus]|uniref:Integrase catalytic domain-containing protein n=1 Tax=Exocentrus adspersus TaxID=1586481 RepID=A0AAV8V9F8_9CUCU|nr:hypothetical protein NQ315_012509 [Exocentrus adspersus]